MFVQREQDKLLPRFGKVKGLFVVKQPGYAEEELPDGHADILEYKAYLAAIPAPVAPTVALIDKLVLKGVLTPADAAALKG
jgi:hypothetical protein